MQKFSVSLGSLSLVKMASEHYALWLIYLIPYHCPKNYFYTACWTYTLYCTEHFVTLASKNFNNFNININFNFKNFNIQHVLYHFGSSQTIFILKAYFWYPAFLVFYRLLYRLQINLGWETNVITRLSRLSRRYLSDTQGTLLPLIQRLGTYMTKTSIINRYSY